MPDVESKLDLKEPFQVDRRWVGSGQRRGGKLNASEGARMRNDSEDPLVQCSPYTPELEQWFGNCLRCSMNYPVYGGSETREFRTIFQLTFSSSHSSV